MSEPFQFRGAWYLFYRDAKGKRKRKKLADTKREAYAIWKAGIRNGVDVHSDAPFSTVANKWLALQEKRLDAGLVSAKWLARASRTIEAFRAVNPRIRCSQITEEVAVDWLPAARSQAYERTEAQILKQILGWAVGRHISSSPLAAMVLEKGRRRERLVSIDEHRMLLAHLPMPKYKKQRRGSDNKRADAIAGLRFLIWVWWWTGARPIELRTLRWEHMRGDCQTALLREHKNDATGKPRTIYFPKNAQAILRRHRKLSGPVFVNSVGEEWTARALGRRIENLVKKAGLGDTELSAYAYRHTLITRALTQGLHVAVVAEMTGTSVEMISRNYGHLEKAKDHIVQAAESLRSF